MGIGCVGIGGMAQLLNPPESILPSVEDRFIAMFSVLDVVCEQFVGVGHDWAMTGKQQVSIEFSKTVQPFDVRRHVTFSTRYQNGANLDNIVC